MASYNNSSGSVDVSDSIPSLETSTSRTIKFILLLIFQLASISCSLFVMVHVLTKSTLRSALHNHTIIGLLVVSFFQTISDLPMVLEYLRVGQASSSIFCLLWNFFALSNYAVGIWLMTWASLERHFLIFHAQLFNTTRRKILCHYIPLMISIFIPWIYYIILIFFYPCTNTFYRSYLFCGWCCYAYNDQLVFFNWLALGVIPTCLITVFSLWLIVRVVMQKRRVQQHINWRQHRRMIIQLLSVSCLYLFFDGPTIIIGLVRLGFPTFAGDAQILYLYYIVYLVPLLVPFVCLSTFRELWNRRGERVHPLMLLGHTPTAERIRNTNTIARLVQTTKV